MSEVLGPERPGGQGLDEHQEESGNRAILALLRDPEVADQVDLVITQRDAAYEVWSARGLVRFERRAVDGRAEYRIVEQIGSNPIGDQRHDVLTTCEDELAAAAAGGHATSDANQAFIEPSQVTYPHAYERIAQLFDSPFAPDLVVSPKCYAFGLQPGQHGALDVVQSRAPLAFAGPGIRPGLYASAPRHVDVAPTICRLLGFPLIDGCDWSGRRASQRGVAADVYLQRQDGRVLEEIIDTGGAMPARAYLVIFDGLSNSELQWLLDRDDPIIANVRRLLDRSARFRAGSTVNFPTITWPSHSALLSGAWCGHHDVVNPTYYDRAARQALAPQGQAMMTEGFLGAGVETLYEAVHRVDGEAALTASIHEPQGRGADHAPLEGRIVGSRPRLKALTAELSEQINPRWQADGHDGVQREALLDTRGLAQMLVLFDDPSHAPPRFTAHEFALTDGAGHEYGPHSSGLRDAIAETDQRLGVALDHLAALGLLDSTLFVFTSDHGMAAQQVALGANPARYPERIGLKAITGEPMIWLRDLAVTVETASDGRTARIIVCDNDADASGERPPIAGAEVRVVGRTDHLLAHVATNAAGIAGFATPPDVAPHDIALSVTHPDFNPRHLRLDGSNLALDLRRELYGR
jgi:hypothetical protein